MDVDDEISNLVDLHMGMFGGGWKWQDLQGLLWLDLHKKKMYVKGVLKWFAKIFKDMVMSWMRGLRDSKICNKKVRGGPRLRKVVRSCLDEEGEVKVESMGGGVVIGVCKKDDEEKIISTDIAKITRKRSKPNKHEHGNG
ncbi:hypothetical protein Tco_0648356 [Tanacetum coccineum]